MQEKRAFFKQKGQKNAKNDDNPEGVAKKNEVIVRKLRKKMHFFVWLFALYLHNSYFLVSKPLSCAFLWE